MEKARRPRAIVAGFAAQGQDRPFEKTIGTPASPHRPPASKSLAHDPRRSRSAQAAAGGSDRLTTDDGGHYIAARFNGPTDTFNHFAQDANFDRGGYRVLESGWANDVKAGKQVYVAITSIYDGSSKRPSTITVVFSVDGAQQKRFFPNSSKGKSHGQ